MHEEDDEWMVKQYCSLATHSNDEQLGMLFVNEAVQDITLSKDSLANTLSKESLGMLFMLVHCDHTPMQTQCQKDYITMQMEWELLH